MKRIRKGITLILMFLSMLFMVACGTDDSKKQDINQSENINLTVSAAASLKDAMMEIGQLYNKEKSNVNVNFNFGASGSLQQQIEQGAPVDLFISAAPKQMNALDEKGLIVEDTRIDLLKNNVVLIVPKENSNINGFVDLNTDRVNKLAVGEPNSVPVGQYSEQVLSKLGILENIKSKEIYAKDVKEVLTWVETGNVDAGIVYTTDAKISDKVQVVDKALDDSHDPVIYPVAAVKSTKNIDEAKAFIEFLTTNKSKAIFEKYGFVFTAK